MLDRTASSSALYFSVSFDGSIVSYCFRLDIAAFLGLLQYRCLLKHYWWNTHYNYSLYIYNLFIHGILFSLRALLWSGGTTNPWGHWWSLRGFHKESILRFIPERYKVLKVLIHLLSHILQRHASWLYIYLSPQCSRQQECVFRYWSVPPQEHFNCRGHHSQLHTKFSLEATVEAIIWC